VKVIDIAQLSAKEMLRPKQIRARIEREINILRSLDHPHIVKLYEAIDKNHKYYIFMELVTNGELLDYIGEDGLPEETQKKYFRQIISAVAYCHKQEVFCFSFVLSLHIELRLTCFHFFSFHFI
jgi:carbon catabolite-derepressing protein kinase